MKGRDLLILAVVLLIGGFAIADALRDDDGGGTAEPGPAETATEPPEETTTSTETQPELGRARFEPVPGAGGALVLVEAGSCAVREFDLPTALEFRNVVARTSCELWAAPVTAKAAIGIGAERGDAVPFRFVDLARPGRDLGTGEAAFGFLTWSPDGLRAAWCDRRRVGHEVEFGRAERRLRGCPAAYTPDGEVAFAEGDRLVVGTETVLTVGGTITAAHFGTDGSIGVVVEGRRIERYEDGEQTDMVTLSPALSGRTPIFSPDNCAFLLPVEGDQVGLLPFGCSPLESQSPEGRTAAWSPNGDWIVVAGRDELVFRRADGSGEAVSWPIVAVEVGWRRG